MSDSKMSDKNYPLTTVNSVTEFLNFISPNASGAPLVDVEYRRFTAFDGIGAAEEGAEDRNPLSMYFPEMIYYFVAGSTLSTKKNDYAHLRIHWFGKTGTACKMLMRISRFEWIASTDTSISSVLSWIEERTTMRVMYFDDDYEDLVKQNINLSPDERKVLFKAVFCKIGKADMAELDHDTLMKECYGIEVSDEKFRDLETFKNRDRTSLVDYNPVFVTQALSASLVNQPVERPVDLPSPARGEDAVMSSYMKERASKLLQSKVFSSIKDEILKLKPLGDWKRTIYSSLEYNRLEHDTVNPMSVSKKFLYFIAVALILGENTASPRVLSKEYHDVGFMVTASDFQEVLRSIPGLSVIISNRKAEYAWVSDSCRG